MEHELTVFFLNKRKEDKSEIDLLTPLKIRIAEVESACAAGAREIDIVIRRGLVLAGDWQGLYDEIRAFREAAGVVDVVELKRPG